MTSVNCKMKREISRTLNSNMLSICMARIWATNSSSTTKKKEKCWTKSKFKGKFSSITNKGYPALSKRKMKKTMKEWAKKTTNMKALAMMKMTRMMRTTTNTSRSAVRKLLSSLRTRTMKMMMNMIKMTVPSMTLTNVPVNTRRTLKETIRGIRVECVEIANKWMSAMTTATAKKV